MTERERQNNALRTFENDLHDLQMRENNLTNQIRDKDTLEASIETMKADIVSFTARLKVVHGFGTSARMSHN
jgi:DNA repair protein RAD50